METFLADLRAAVTELERNFMCKCHGKYMPADIAQHWRALWLVVMKPINQAAEHYAPGETDTIKMYTAIQKCVDIMMKDPPAPAGFGRNPLDVVRRMLTVADLHYQLPAKEAVTHALEQMHFPQGVPEV
jgi:hypothetical protein